ncbi:helix-turn-helix domain-containing protein [Altibacter sp. HG106]|uniref:helix-turn-helix domain-containing protein n=1 Tax=Altibacter sp. HG106 TaxID=3023937 RepID=UPI002350AC41|nr:helix-turn-helix domain-containing protein [Altibacter sp. HG106]MDC7995756.1 helix-turn-helix domain-containing protein [Altibacter sp. HG106]
MPVFSLYSICFKSFGKGLLWLCCFAIILTNASAQALDGEARNAVPNYKEQALQSAAAGDAEAATEALEKYLSATGDLTLLNDHLFASIKEDAAYTHLKAHYLPKLSLLGVLYILAGLFGVFVSIMLFFRRTKKSVTYRLMGAFVLFHSLFILHLSLYVTNLQYSLPHALLLSTTFSFLYGPLLYFYFKRVILNYTFRWSDLLHLVPSVGLFLYIVPFYLLPEISKVEILFSRTDYLMPGAVWIIFGKILSLTIYGFLIYRLYEKNRSASKEHSSQALWQRNIVAIYSSYVVAYIAYALVLVKWVPVSELIHPQIVVMIVLVLYISYVTYNQPEVFAGKTSLPDPGNLFKYKKSRLTDSLSEELKEELLRLLEQEEVYKDNSLSLQKLAELLETSRHSASQVINQHFQMNFYELINSYRVRAAMQLLESEANQQRNIIDIAYEVGFNNKVSFNKSFKRIAATTPSQFIASLSQS